MKDIDLEVSYSNILVCSENQSTGFGIEWENWLLYMVNKIYML